jgi:hypothetical protein
MQALLEKAVEAYRRQRFLEETNRALEALRASPQAWKTEQAERKAWDSSLADGLQEE